MEPTNHPFGKENDLNRTSMIRFQPLIFKGVVAGYLLGTILLSIIGIIAVIAFRIPATGHRPLECVVRVGKFSLRKGGFPVFTKIFKHCFAGQKMACNGQKYLGVLSKKTRWWFQVFFNFIFTPKVGEDSHF